MATNGGVLWRRIIQMMVALALSATGCGAPSDGELLQEAIETVGSGRSTEISILWHHDVENTDLAGLENLAGLERLYLDDAMINDTGMDHIAPLRQLIALSLTRTRVTDAAIARLAGFDSLEMLWLDGVQISDESLKTLAKLPKLKSLSLLKDHITDQGLVEIGKMSRLEALNLDETQITDAGLKNLAALKNLNSLSVSITSVTDRGAAELKAALPNVKINR